MKKVSILNIGENSIKEINTLYAFVSSDEHGEGICSQLLGNKWMSLVTADIKIANLLKIKAKEIARASGKKIKLIKLTSREVLEEFE